MLFTSLERNYLIIKHRITFKYLPYISNVNSPSFVSNLIVSTQKEISVLYPYNELRTS